MPQSFKFLSHVKLDESELKDGQKKYMPKQDLDTQAEATRLVKLEFFSLALDLN